MTGENNPFRRIFDAATDPKISAPVQPETSPQPETKSQPEPEQQLKQRGRPRGKKSDPEYEAAIVYVRKKTHLQVKRLLLDKEELGEKQDFSELVQELLDFWVQIQQDENPEILIAGFSDIQKPKKSGP
jgi:hypothetical protein